MATQLCEYMKKHWTVYFKKVIFIAYELYVNKAFS